MKRHKHRYRLLKALLLLLLCGRGLPASSQQIINSLDTSLINKAAQAQLESFIKLLHAINYEAEPERISNIIRTPFLRNSLFRDSSVVIEDDLDPTVHTTGGIETPVMQYLRDFNRVCAKTDEDNTVLPVVISTIAYAPLRKNSNGYYLRVYYNEQFNVKRTVAPDTPFSVNTRVADFQIRKEKRRWVAYISSIGFIGLDDINADMAGKANLVDILTDSSSIREMMSEKEIMEREAERENNKFVALEDAGQAAEENGNYLDAYIAYNEMADLRPLERKPRVRISQLKKQLQKNGKSPDDYFYAGFMEKGRQAAERSYDYDKAINYYERAAELRPSLTDTINGMIAVLREKYKQQQFLEARYKERKYDDARKGYEEAIRQDPNNSDLYCGLAHTLEALGRKKEKVTEAYSKAITLNDHNLKAIIGLADYYQSQNEFASALAQYKVYLSYDRNNPEIYMQMASLKIRQSSSNTPDALHDIDEAIKIRPDAAGLYVTKGKILYANGSYKEALSLFNKATTKDPYSAAAFYNLGLSYVAVNNIPEAAKAFAEARINKPDTAALNRIDDIALHFYELSQNNREFYKKYSNKASMDSARQMIGYAIILSPNTAAYYGARGKLSVLEQKYPEAIRDFTEAINRNRNYTDAYIWRGQMYLELRQYDTALNDFSIALSQSAGQNSSQDIYTFTIIPAAKGRCDALFYLRRYPEAIAEYTALVERIRKATIRPAPALQAEVHHYLASACYENNNNEEAMNEVKEALRINENYAAAYFTRGLIYKRKGKIKDAIDDIKKALELDKAQARWNFELGELSRQQEAYAYAAQCYTAAMIYAKTNIPIALYNRGYCYYKLDEYSLALNDYRPSQQAGIDKRIPGFNNEMGYLYARSGLLDSAYQCYFTAYTANQLDADACFGLGAVAYLRNKADAETYYAWFDKAFQHKKLEENYIKKHPPLIGDLKEEKRYKDLIKKYY